MKLLSYETQIVRQTVEALWKAKCYRFAVAINGDEPAPLEPETAFTILTRLPEVILGAGAGNVAELSFVKHRILPGDPHAGLHVRFRVGGGLDVIEDYSFGVADVLKPLDKAIAEARAVVPADGSLNPAILALKPEEADEYVSALGSAITTLDATAKMKMPEETAAVLRRAGTTLGGLRAKINDARS